MSLWAMVEEGAMRKKRPHVATLSEVKIQRAGEEAVITYRDPTVAVVHLRIGPSIQSMTDAEVLDLHNRVLQAQEKMARELENVAIEIPAGRPQITYTSECDQWVPRGSVLRCIVHDGGPDGEANIEIDDHELSLDEFGKLLTTYAGWGMRIIFVPRDETEQQPEIEVRDVREGEPVHGRRAGPSSFGDAAE